MLLPLLLLLLVPLQASAAKLADSAPFVFEGEVRIDARPPRSVRLSLPPAHISMLPLEAGYLLHFQTPPPDEMDQITHVYLVRPDGKHFQVLHDGITGARASQVRGFGYVVCGTRVTYIPVQRKLPSCAEIRP